MQYRFELRWNGEIVAEGSATLVCAAEICAAHMEQFAGASFKRWKAWQEEQGSPLMLLDCNGELMLAYRDETGAAVARARYYTKEFPPIRYNGA